MTKVPVVLSVAPMTSSPGPLTTGIGSPVSIDSSIAEAPSTTTPSTGTLSPGRTRRRSPTTTDSSATSASTSPRTSRADVGRSADEPADRAGRPALGARLQPAPEQDEPDDDRRAVEVGDGLEAGVDDDRGREGQHDAVRPGGARADRDERVHVGRAVAGGPPGRAVEPTAGPDLDERRRDEREPVALLHRGELGRGGHEDHDREGDGDRDDRLDEQDARLAGAGDVVGRPLLGQRGAVGLGSAAVGRSRTS